MNKERRTWGWVLVIVLVIAVGCTGGHHRSVAVSHALAAAISALGYRVTEDHRDLTR